MLQSYLPIYQLALDLQALRGRAELLRGSTYHRPGLSESDAQSYVVLLKALQKCSAYNFYHTAEMAKRIAGRTLCADYNDLYSDLTHLNDTLSHELEKEAVFRIAPEQKDYFERKDLFGPEVAAATQPHACKTLYLGLRFHDRRLQRLRAPAGAVFRAVDSSPLTLTERSP